MCRGERGEGHVDDSTFCLSFLVIKGQVPAPQ